jgi:hypothetical protein
MNEFLREVPNRMNDDDQIDHNNMLMIRCMYNLLFHHVKLDELHDRDLYRLIVCTIYVLQFRILVDRYNPFYCNMWLHFVFVNDYDDEQFLSMYVIHRRVFGNELRFLHDRQVNENLAMDNHFDWRNAMVHVVMMRL